MRLIERCPKSAKSLISFETVIVVTITAPSLEDEGIDVEDGGVYLKAIQRQGGITDWNVSDPIKNAAICASKAHEILSVVRT